jgi:hypothetical protein
MIVLTPLMRAERRAAAAASQGRWVLAAVETPVIGLDARTRRDEWELTMQRSPSEYVACGRSSSSRSVCQVCARPARLTAAEMDYLFPTQPLLHESKIGSRMPGL